MVLFENINYSVHFLQYSILRNIHFIEKISDNLSDPEWDNSYSYPRFWAGCDGLKWWAPVLSPMCSVWKLLCVPLLDPEHTLEEDQVLFYCSSFMSVLCAPSSKPFLPGIVLNSDSKIKRLIFLRLRKVKNLWSCFFVKPKLISV